MNILCLSPDGIPDSINKCLDKIDISEGIDITVKDSVSSFFDEIDGQTYGLVLIDQSIGDDLFGIIEEVRNSFPSLFIVALLDSSDEKTISQCYKKGATDYLIKGGLETIRLKEIILSSAQGYEDGARAHSLDISSIRLLEELAKGKLEGIEPTIDHSEGATEIRYPEAEEILDLEPEAVKEKLENFVERHLLKKKFLMPVFLCPDCELETRFTPYCPYCQSMHLEKRGAIEHLSCGYIGLESEFDKVNQLVCPECNDQLEALGVDYSKPGSHFICKDCGETFDKPEEGMFCQECGKIHDLSETRKKEIYKYQLNEDMQQWIREKLLPLQQFEKYFENKGYKVRDKYTADKNPAAAKGIDILARNEETGETIAVLISENTDVNEISKAYIIGEKVDAKPILISLSNYNGEIENLAGNLGIEIISKPEIRNELDISTSNNGEE
ncbi:MAG: hypothetical protein V5A77_07170 [Candidatus Bipolaricaulota bacterium]|nr:hypothetical protein [Candidatus Bipolaricaulota bacterium]MBS3793008.1 hypothetical protein [Candidatus Bipolaricaulota bacterium]